MKIEIKVPAMGESISEVVIGSILVPSGQSVKADQEILELETDKVNQLLYAPKAGIVNLTVQSGQLVKIGQVIGTIDTEAKLESAKRPTPPVEEKTETPKREEITSAEAPKPEQPIKQPEASIRYTQEKFLEELQQEPKQTTKQEQPAQVPAVSDEERETRQRLSGIRKVIANRLIEAQQTTVMLTTFNEVDMTQVTQAREKYKDVFIKKYGVKLGFMSFFVKACIKALKAFPDLNSYIDGEELVRRNYYDIGIAVGTERGLIVPVVRQCDQLSFADIEKAIESFAKKAREGGLTVADLQGGGFTITNGGIYGSLLSTPILNPPQSGILGMHKMMKRPVVVDDQIVIRSMMYLALSYDHRIVDGKEAVSFLVAIKEALEDPTRLLLEI